MSKNHEKPFPSYNHELEPPRAEHKALATLSLLLTVAFCIGFWTIVIKIVLQFI